MTFYKVKLNQLINNSILPLVVSRQLAVESNMTLEELYDNPDEQELKPDGTYKCGDDTLHVFNFDNPDLKLFSQQLFVAYQ